MMEPAKMRVTYSVSRTELEGDYGYINGIACVCSRCNHRVSVFGTQQKSIRRAAVMLREECPNNEENYYISEDDE